MPGEYVRSIHISARRLFAALMSQGVEVSLRSRHHRRPRGDRSPAHRGSGSYEAAVIALAAGMAATPRMAPHRRGCPRRPALRARLVVRPRGGRLADDFAPISYHRRVRAAYRLAVARTSFCGTFSSAHIRPSPDPSRWQPQFSKGRRITERRPSTRRVSRGRGGEVRLPVCVSWSRGAMPRARGEDPPPNPFHDSGREARHSACGPLLGRIPEPPCSSLHVLITIISYAPFCARPRAGGPSGAVLYSALVCPSPC